MANTITYTFPVPFAIAEYAGKTVEGGKPEMLKGEQIVRFRTRIGGNQIMVRVAGRPDLAAAVAEYKAAVAAEEAAYAASPRGQYEALRAAEYNSYDPNAFPGSAKNIKHQQAAAALAAFEAANPDLMATLAAERKAERDARYADMSEFARMGS